MDAKQGDCSKASSQMQTRSMSKGPECLPLDSITSNQLFQMLGAECNTATRKRSVTSSVSGLRRSRTFTASDRTQHVTVLRARDDAPVSTQSSVCESTERNICLQAGSESHYRSATKAIARTKSNASGLPRVAFSKTAGRTPPPVSKTSVDRKKKSLSLKRMSSLRHLAVDAPSTASSSAVAPEPFVPKIAIVGAEMTGKSALVTRWLRGSSPESTHYEPTVEDRFQHTLSVNGREQTVEIIDTSGAEDCRDMRDRTIRSAHAILLVYDVTQPVTLEWLRRECHEFVSESGQDGTRPFIILVANKIDCQALRQLSNYDGTSFAKDLHCEYLETSARSGINVDEVLRRLVKPLGKKTSVSKSSANVSRSRSFLARTVGAIRPKRRPKLPAQWDSGSGDIATLRPGVSGEVPPLRGKVRVKLASKSSESNV